MKFKLGQIFVWFFLAYLLYWLRDMARDPDWADTFEWLWDQETFVIVTVNFISFFTYSFVSYTILFYFHQRGKTSLSIILLILSIPLVVFFRYFLQEILQETIFGYGNYVDGYPLYEYFLDNLYYGLYYPWVGGIFYFVQFSRYKDQQQKELQIQNQQSQLSLLRSQINPHFLFNSLNNIYSLVYQKSDRSLESIEKLSSLLRYSLYEKEEKVEIRKEIRFLEDFIDLETMRYDFEVPIDFQINLHHNALKIIPFLFISLVENAFKHGDPKKGISINLLEEDGNLVFSCHNFIRQQEKDQVGGIGLDNIQKRLKLYYGLQQDFSVQMNDQEFEASIKIALNQC